MIQNTTVHSKMCAYISSDTHCTVLSYLNSFAHPCNQQRQPGNFPRPSFSFSKLRTAPRAAHSQSSLKPKRAPSPFHSLLPAPERARAPSRFNARASVARDDWWRREQRRLLAFPQQKCKQTNSENIGIDNIWNFFRGRQLI